MNILIYIIAYLFFSTFGLMLLKSSMSGVDVSSISEYIKLFCNFRFLVGFCFYVISFLVWLVLLSKKELSFIYPVVIGLSYVSIMVMASLILKESFTVAKLMGVIVVGIGVILIFVQK